MSDTEVPFQIVKHKKFRRKHNGHMQQCKAREEPCHVDDHVVEPCTVLEKLHSCR